MRTIENQSNPGSQVHELTRKKLMVALDYPDLDEAKALVEELGDKVHWYKVGPALFTRCGNQIIDFLHSRRKDILLDTKIYDTPKVVQETVMQLADLGIRMATVHCLGGHEMLESASLGCRGSELALLGVTLITSQTSKDLALLSNAPVPDNSTSANLVTHLMKIAVEHRLSGILCSPHETAQAREQALPGFLIVNAGLRIPGIEVYQDDQKRVSSPAIALELGADYLIVGRPITQAREPLMVLDRLFDGASDESPSNA